MLRGHVFKYQTFSNEAFAHFITTFLSKKNGITKGCELSKTTTSVTISEGFFCICGRFLEIVGNNTISNINENGYYNLICEIDLTKENTKTELNQAEIKLLKGTNTYPTLTQQDLDEDGTKYQYSFCKFKVSDSTITDFTDTRTFLEFDSIYSQISSKFEEMYNEKNEELTSILNDLEEELNSITDRSGLVLKGDFAIISGQITLAANTTINVNSKLCNFTSVLLDMPTGFTPSNTEVVSFSRQRISGTRSFPKTYGWSNQLSSADMNVSNEPTNIQLYEEIDMEGEGTKTNQIFANFGNYATSQKTIYYTITLFKK